MTSPTSKPRIRVRAISRRCRYPGECNAPHCPCLPTSFYGRARVVDKPGLGPILTTAPPDEDDLKLPAFLDRRTPPA